MKATDKETNRWVRAAVEQGWTVAYTGSGHIKFCPPRGGMVVVSSTPGGGRSRQNSRSQLKRTGLIL